MSSSLGVLREDPVRARRATSSTHQQQIVVQGVCERWRARVPFLTFTFSILCGSAALGTLFDDVIERDPAFAFMIPLIIGHSGNCGGQTAATVVGDLRCGMGKPLLNVLWEETFLSSVSTTLLLGAFVPAALAVGASTQVIGASVITLMLLANAASMFAISSCYIASAVSIDPAVCAGPIMTTLIDLFGVLVFLGIGKLLLPV